MLRGWYEFESRLDEPVTSPIRRRSYETFHSMVIALLNNALKDSFDRVK